MGDVFGGDNVGNDKVGGNKNIYHYYTTPQSASQPAPPMPLDQALALLNSLPAGPDDPIPPQDAFQTSPVPRWLPLTTNELFVGRDAALRDLAAQLKAGEGVVITTGMGGVGKTQLAVEFAHRYGSYFGGGVFWLDASSPERLEDSIAACGLVLIRDGAFGKQPRAEQLRLVQACWAEPLPRLLIFDNGEDPALLRQYRPPSGGCRVLVTSRNQRWPAGERLAVYPLEVLGRAQSVALLRALAPRLSDAQANGIAEELGDLPLALHLAGSFLASSPSVDPAAFRERVRARSVGHPALGGDTTAPTYRQQQRASSLEAVFQISLERLDPHDPLDALARTLLARAAGLQPHGWPFPRRFLVQTAPKQDGADPDGPPAEAAVERLLQLGLLEAEGADRLRLHRLLAGFAWIALDGPTVFDAFAPVALAWVAALIAEAEDQSITHDVESRAILDQERPLWEQFLDWGYAHEQQPERCASARATAALRNYWMISGALGQAATRERLQQALAAAQRLDDRFAQANTRKAIGDVQQFRKELEAAQGSYAAALELFRAVGDRLGEAHTLFVIGNVQQFRKELEAAQGSYAAALELYRAVGSRLGEANTLRAIGDVQRFRKELEAAQGSYAAALELFRVVGSRLGEGNVLAAQSELWLDSDPVRSREALEAALALRRAIGSAYDEGIDLGNYGLALLQRGRGQEALPYLQRARAIFAARGLTAQVQWVDGMLDQPTSGETG
ncbi:MAG: hypothetical protein OHK0022_55450 [Roseiflexaceae bacterium]